MGPEDYSTIIILCFLSLLTLGTGFWFRFYPPKEINLFFGYRTKNSMKGQQQWNFAHHYSGGLFILYGIILFIAAIIVLIFEANSHSLNIIVAILFISGSLMLILNTEKAINKKFDP